MENVAEFIDLESIKVEELLAWQKDSPEVGILETEGME